MVSRLASTMSLAVFLVLLPLAAAGAQGVDLAQPLPVDPQLIRGRLENGFTYYIRVNRKPEKRAALRLVINAGSIVEDDDQRGLAHFVEHMAFNGTRHFKGREMVDFFESLGQEMGPHVNAFTDFDETLYSLEVPTGDPATLAKAFQALEDWAHGITFDEREVVKERGVLREEWRSNMGADTRMRDKWLPVVLKTSRYARRRPEGQQEIIEKASPAALRRFYKDWYRPDLMAVVAVGDFEPRQVEAWIRQHFGTLEKPKHPRPRERYGVPDNETTLVSVVTDPEETKTLIGIYHKHDASPTRTVGDYRNLILEALYRQMLNGRLGELLLKPSPPFISASVGTDSGVRSNNFSTLSFVPKQGELAQGLEALISEAKRIEAHGFTASELARAKCQLLKTSENDYQERNKIASDAFASFYVSHFLRGARIHGVEVEYQLDQKLLPGIGLQDVHRIAQRWSGDRNRVILITAPKSAAASLPKESALLAVLRRVEAAKLKPYVDAAVDRPLLAKKPRPSKVVKEKKIDALGATEWTFGNGVKLVLKPTTYQNDEIRYEAFSPGGASLTAPQDFLSTAVAAGLVSRSGLGEFSAPELTKKLACYESGVDPFIDMFEEGIRGVAAPAELETVFQRIYLSLTAPRGDADALRTIQDRLREAFRRQSPEEEFAQLVTSVMTRNDPRFRWPTEKEVAQLNVAKSLATYRDRFGDAGDFTFVMVGNLPMKQLRPLAETYLGGLPSRGRKETAKALNVHPPRGVVKRELRRGMAAKSSVRLVFTGPYRWGPEEHFLLASMGIVLQSRLEEHLREKLGATYGVSVNAECFHESCLTIPNSEYQIDVAFDCDPAKVEQLIREVFRDIEKLKASSEGPGAVDVENVRKQWRSYVEVQSKNNQFWLQRLKRYYSTGEIIDLPRWHKLIDGLSREALREAARKYLDIGNYAQFVLYPESH